MSALLPMPALSDTEDSPPHFRSKMSDNETTETLAPPTDREAPTNRENGRPEPRVAIRPQPADPWDTSFLDQDDSTFSAAVKMIANAARANEQARLAAEAAASERKRFEEQHLNLQSEILTCVQRAEKSQEANFKILNHAVQELQASDLRQDGRLAQGDERFIRIERSIAAVKEELIALVTREMKSAADKIEALETELGKLRDNDVPARPPQTTPTG